MLTTTLAKLVTVKIAGIAATAVAAGGIAVAAATGHLPAQKGDTPTVPPITSHAPGKPSTASTASTETSDAAEPKTSDSATPSPSLEGLCHAYTAGAGADHGKALDNPAFTFLITTAGGADKVPAYCAELLGDQPGKSTVTPPKGEPTHPDGRPTDVPNPSGPPSAHPTR